MYAFEDGMTSHEEHTRTHARLVSVAYHAERLISVRLLSAIGSPVDKQAFSLRAEGDLAPAVRPLERVQYFTPVVQWTCIWVGGYTHIRNVSAKKHTRQKISHKT